ncbi:MAG: NAD(P)H-hydrate dehydratase [Bacteriovoracaceae bacterium]|nr:NAD(P)H-hydrate dehydratase [Bacteriovoracaceae bacterium]
MRIVTVEEMKQIEKKTFEDFHMQERLVIENVGTQIAEAIEREFLSQQNASYEIVFLIGKGNNGSDGLATARHLANNGHKVVVFRAYPISECSPECQAQLKMAMAYGVVDVEALQVETLQSYFLQSSHDFLVVDALFGVGVRLPLSQHLYDLINFVNDHAKVTIAIDVPSGVSGDSGQVMGNAINAQLTYCIGAIKIGCLLADGITYSGRVDLINGGFPNTLLEKGDKFQITLNDVMAPLQKRSKFSDKKTNGHVLIVGGSSGLTGALVMATHAAMKVGAGLVTAGTWAESYTELMSRIRPEAMTFSFSSNEQSWDKFKNILPKFDAVVVGPGLGLDEKARSVVTFLLQFFHGPLIIDADGLRVLDIPSDAEMIRNRKGPTLLTPHMGEFAGLTKKTKSDISLTTMSSLQELVHKLSCTVVLKGPCTFIAGPTGKTFFHHFPNDGMAKGGSGDVLAGILGGLLAQQYSSQRQGSDFQNEEWAQSILLAIYLHSRAGLHAAQKEGTRSMTAMSILDGLPETFKEFESGKLITASNSP